VRPIPPRRIKAKSLPNSQAENAAGANGQNEKQRRKKYSTNPRKRAVFGERSIDSLPPWNGPSLNCNPHAKPASDRL